MSVDRQLEKRANREHPGVLAGLSGDKKNQILSALYPQGAKLTQSQQVVQHTAAFQSSPVPPPDFLAGYNQQIPDGANRLFILIENQSAHRIKSEDSVIATQNKATLRGQWFAFALVLLMCVIAYHAMDRGYETLAGIIFGTTIVGVASVFISGKVSVTKSLKTKKPS